jgi:uncharacterized protein
MASESRLMLNPEVSVFGHREGVYLFDPATRTYASMNEAMLQFITRPDDSLDELSDEERLGLTHLTKHLHRLGILIEPGAVNTTKTSALPDAPGATTTLGIFVTTKCNLRCAYCYAEGGDTKRTISRDTWLLAMNNFFSNLRSSAAEGKAGGKYVRLELHGGGEVTVEFAILKDIVAEFYARAHGAGMKASAGVSTNGTYKDSVHRWIVENSIGVSISLDGPRDVHNFLRPFRGGRPSYDVVVRNIQRLIQSGRYVPVRATVTNETLGSMEETIEVAKQLNIPEVHFEPVALTGRAINGVTRPDAEQFVETFLKCFLLGLKYDVGVRYSGMRCFENPQGRFCGACGPNFGVTPDGNISSCYEVLGPTDPAASTFFIGKVDPIQRGVVWNEARIDKLQRRVAANIGACNDCFLRNHCAGDCPIRGFRYSNGNLYARDLYRCQITQGVNKQLIAWLADGAIEARDVAQANVYS